MCPTEGPAHGLGLSPWDGTCCGEGHTLTHPEGLLVGVTLKGHCDGDTGDPQPILPAAVLEFWVSITGTALGLPQQDRGAQQGWGSWDRAGLGQTSFEPVPIPLPQPTQP